MPSRRIEFYHAPRSRSAGTLALLEELKASYQPHVMSLQANEQRQPAYLAINPMGKVPAIVHHKVVVTEQGAIFIYLSDLYPEHGLSPILGDPWRGAWLRWLVFYGSSFEPAVIDRARKAPPASASSSPYGDFDTMFATLEGQLQQGPYLLGERFTTADILWGSALKWTTQFDLVPATPTIQAYIERVTSRPSFIRAAEIDAQWLAVQNE
ncbi:glutathione S-transferase family protein [Pseudomonas sp. LRF_L74]|uniref:glutathione S-transferase family protein n=1 Tax=Pseudomonas sp. LRF_L74 TaxID=3369422 RepID=UPI003F63096D